MRPKKLLSAFRGAVVGVFFLLSGDVPENPIGNQELDIP